MLTLPQLLPPTFGNMWVRIAIVESVLIVVVLLGFMTLVLF